MQTHYDEEMLRHYDKNIDHFDKNDYPCRAPAISYALESMDHVFENTKKTFSSYIPRPKSKRKIKELMRNYTCDTLSNCCLLPIYEYDENSGSGRCSKCHETCISEQIAVEIADNYSQKQNACYSTNRR